MDARTVVRPRLGSPELVRGPQTSLQGTRTRGRRLRTMVGPRVRKVYTRTGDDGTTALLYGGRVGKDTVGPDAYGAVDEAVSALGLARAETDRGSELDELLV